MSENELNDSIEEAKNEEFVEEVNEIVEPDTTEFEATEIEDNAADVAEAAEEFVDKKKEDEEEPDDKDDGDDSEEDDSEEDEDKKKPKNQHSLEEFEALQAELNSLRAENKELRNFKLNVENQQKDELIASYHMLSDEDKAEVINHKSEYSLDEIKAKLAVIYVEKNVNFDMIDGQEEVESDPEPSMTFSLDEEASEGVPAFIEALRLTRNI